MLTLPFSLFESKVPDMNVSNKLSGTEKKYRYTTFFWKFYDKIKYCVTRFFRTVIEIHLYKDVKFGHECEIGVWIIVNQIRLAANKLLLKSTNSIIVTITMGDNVEWVMFSIRSEGRMARMHIETVDLTTKKFWERLTV